MTKKILLCASMLLLMVSVACASGSQVAPTTPTTPPSTRTPGPNTTLARSFPTPTLAPAPLPATEARVPRVTADGSLSFVKHVKLSFGTSGRVAQVNVSELDRVNIGQVLAKLDTTALEQAVKAAEFGVRAAELTLKSAESDRSLAEYGIKSAEADLKTMQGNLAAAGIDLEQAKDNFREIAYPYNYHTIAFDVPEALEFIGDASREIDDASAALQIGISVEKYNAVSNHLKEALDRLNKSRELLARGYGDDVFLNRHLSISDFWTLRAAQLQADRAQVVVENAENAVNKTALTVENAKVAFSKAQAAEDKARNDVDRAKNDLNRSRDDLQKAIITAPIDGVIARVNIEELDLLSSANYANTIAIEIIDPGRMELDVRVNELDVPNIKLGQKVTISVDALPDQRFDSVISSIGSLPVAGSSVVLYEVKIVFDVPQNSALKAGMHATADFIADKS